MRIGIICWVVHLLVLKNYEKITKDTNKQEMLSKYHDHVLNTCNNENSYDRDEMAKFLINKQYSDLDYYDFECIIKKITKNAKILKYNVPLNFYDIIDFLTKHPKIEKRQKSTINNILSSLNN